MNYKDPFVVFHEYLNDHTLSLGMAVPFISRQRYPPLPQSCQSFLGLSNGRGRGWLQPVRALRYYRMWFLKKKKKKNLAWFWNFVRDNFVPLGMLFFPLSLCGVDRWGGSGSGSALRTFSSLNSLRAPILFLTMVTSFAAWGMYSFLYGKFQNDASDCS